MMNEEKPTCFRCGMQVSKDQFNKGMDRYECHKHMVVDGQGPQPMMSEDFSHKRREDK